MKIIMLEDAKKHKTEKAAIKATIGKWGRIIEILKDGDIPGNVGTGSCALCMKYPSLFCQGCPIARKTGHCFCRETPFDSFVYSLHKLRRSHFKRSKRIHRAEALNHAWEMLWFLAKLKPTKKKRGGK